MSPSLQGILNNPAIWRGGDLPSALQPALSSGFSSLDAELPGGGWPVGTLTEVLGDGEGVGELSLLLPLLARLTREGLGVAWVAPPYLPYAPALALAGVDLKHCLVVTAAATQDALWVAEQALRSGACGAVLAWLDRNGAPVDYRALRRLQLAAEAGRAMGFLYRPARMATIPSPAPLRLSLAAQDAHLLLRILKRRGAVASGALRLALQGLRRRGMPADADPMPAAGGTVLPIRHAPPAAVWETQTAVH